MEIELTPFDEHDWMAFAGAEGEEPCIAYEDDFTVVLGGTVLEVYLGEEPELCYSLTVDNLSPLGAATLLLPVPTGDDTTSGEVLKALGFKSQPV